MATSARPPNGVLPMPASQTSPPTNGSRQATAKQPSQKLKLIVRRLAPALTQDEFVSILGEEWKLGSGKVDWFRYVPGKDSKDPAKPSRPSRAYLHLSNEAHLIPFSDVVRQTNFEDAANTSTSSCLIGPPVVEFAPYSRTPAGRPKVDARAGTIDQDAEFMAFLEGLANPVTSKEIGTDVGDTSNGKQEKVTTTPLVQFLKDKKAIKNKESALKAAKKHDSKSSKAASSTSPDDTKKKAKEVKPERALERAAKEAVKILNREAAKASSSSGSSSAATANTSSEIKSDTPPKLDISKIPLRQRNAATAAHIRMLKRDLGFSPAQAHRQVQRDTADVQKAEKAAAAEKAATAAKAVATGVPQTTSSPSAPKANTPQPNSRRSRAKGNDSGSTRASGNASSSKATTSQAPAPQTPIILLRKPETNPSASTPTPTPTAQPTKTASVVPARKPQATPTPTEGATQAFVKHANPSQGVTEALLKEAMEVYGLVSHVEIDRRKGFAYVDFINSDGLKKAMAANPITVGQGTVQVLQRKGAAPVQEKKPANTPTPQNPPPRGPPQNNNAPLRGGRGGGRGGGTVGRRGGRSGGRGGSNNTNNSEASKAPSSAPTGPAAK